MKDITRTRWVGWLALFAAACGTSYSPDDDARDATLIHLDGSAWTRDAASGRDASSGDLDAGEPDPFDAGVMPDGDGGSVARDAASGSDAGPRERLGIGAACERNLDCEGRICYGDEFGFADGYCTAECDDRDPCPAGSECLRAFGAPSGICAIACSAPTDCRPGYACLQVRLGVRVCYPGCSDSDDCAEGDRCVAGSCVRDDAVVGDACDVTVGCGPDDYCATEASTGFPGGMCLRWECSSGPAGGCPSGTVCASVWGDACVPTCGSDEDCRAGWRCAFEESEPHCKPACREDSQCREGASCIGLTGLCY